MSKSKWLIARTLASTGSQQTPHRDSVEPVPAARRERALCLEGFDLPRRYFSRGRALIGAWAFRLLFLAGFALGDA
jgi:hypothetical protein